MRVCSAFQKAVGFGDIIWVFLSLFFSQVIQNVVQSSCLALFDAATLLLIIRTLIVFIEMQLSIAFQVVHNLLLL